MTDGIILGTGNSRYLKGAGWPATYEEFKSMAEAGTLPIDLNGINEAGWQQIGTALNKANLLDDNTSAVLELAPENQTVNKAILSLALPTGKYAVLVTALTPGGRPISGATVTGITSRSGGKCITDSNGTTVGFTTESTVTLQCTSPLYLDFTSSSLSETVELLPNTLNKVTFTFSRGTITEKLFTSSQSILFSPDVDEFDCSVVAGGKSGTSGDASRGSFGVAAYAGKGGDSGAVANAENIKNKSASIDIIVGAASGDSNITVNNETIITTVGQSGAIGGSGAIATRRDVLTSYSRHASSGNFPTISFKHPATTVGGSGGGGGAYADISNEPITNVTAGASGKQGGGAGGSSTYNSAGNGSSGNSYPGAGGGGGAATANYSSGETFTSGRGGVGKAGVAGIVWRYKA
ncbi:hypothetical protein OBV_18230 [Oscillibacter valericigenes Sjm18-20]|nr:hypothetical protein OBV_18230 [Oscillibacter valericigenes Sjm18-20]